jgi:hypothetical protein
MLKNVTLSAEAELIEQARRRAREEHKTLNALFREWLLRYAGTQDRVERYRQLTKELGHVRAGRKFTREEMNER